MESVIRVEIAKKAVHISFRANALRKGTNLSSFPPQWDSLDSLALVGQPVFEKKNSNQFYQ